MVSGGVATVDLDLPPLQLVGQDLIVGLFQLLPQLEAQAVAGEVRVVVFRSPDPDFFLMHGDVELLVAHTSTYDPTQPVTEPNVAAALFERINQAPFVTIGMIDGVARGGGCEFLSALDLRYGTPRTRIGQPEAAMGILPGAGGTVRWPRLVGRARALELILTGRDLDAGEALALGWLNAVVPSDQLEQSVMRLANRIAALPADVIASVKQVVDASLAGDDQAMALENDALTRLMSTGEPQRRMARFLAAGGQTRPAEQGDITALLDAMLD